MSLRLYNTLTRTKDLFDPVSPGKVGMYLCGPTVYKSPHIGHMVGPVIFDALKRFLVFKGFAVTWVVNITDVDDKIIETAANRGQSVQEIAEQYGTEYTSVLVKLGINSIDHFPKASVHMPEIIAMIEKLIERGGAYATQGNVWFDVAKDPNYGKLSGRKLDEQFSGNRELEGAGKRNPADFGLWKAAKPGEVAWDSPWGQGRPGWHIECSAMSQKILGDTFDIHGGGMDLLFPHHENELAQSECCTGKPFAKIWMHNGLTRIRTKLSSGEWSDAKMSGSVGNVVSAEDLITKHGADTLRYLILSTHYRSPIEFTDAVLANSSKALAGFDRLAERAVRIRVVIDDKTPDADRAVDLFESTAAAFVQEIIAQKMRFLEALDDDFNTSGAIAVMHEIVSKTNAFIDQNKLDASGDEKQRSAVASALKTVQSLGKILGLFSVPRSSAPGDDNLSNGLMSVLIGLRAEARKTKNFALADTIRKELTAIGVTIEDNPSGTTWRRS